MNDAKISAGSPGELTPPGGPPGVPPAEGGAASSPEPYTICVRALSGEATTLKEAVRQCAAEAEARRQAGAEDEARRRAEIARDVAQLGPAQLKAKYDTVRDARARARARRSAAFGEGSARRARATLTRVVHDAPPAERESRGALERGEGRQDGGRSSIHRYGSRR